MTHLGLCSAIAAASKGFDTVCFDDDAVRTERLTAGSLPVTEPRLAELLREHRDRISFTSDRSALRDCDLVYVAPDVPTDDSGQSDLCGLDALLTSVLGATGDSTAIVVLSQVPPGFTRSCQRPDRHILYQVETLVFGRAVERATRPERIVLGCLDPAAKLPAALETFLRSFDCPILPMRLESAELTKIAINCCLAASIATTNSLSELCERLGADWSEIAPALRLDKRIGPHAYLSAGLGLAGGNLERDLATISRLSEELGTEAGLIKAIVANSRHRKDWVLRTLHAAVLADAPAATIGILGLAYKENTNSIKNSPALALIRDLGPWRLQIYDPVVDPDVAPHPAAIGMPTALAAAKGVDALAIMTPWPQFAALSPAELADAMAGKLVLDPYRVLDARLARAAGMDYRTLGM